MLLTSLSHFISWFQHFLWLTTTVYSQLPPHQVSLGSHLFFPSFIPTFDSTAIFSLLAFGSNLCTFPLYGPTSLTISGRRNRSHWSCKKKVKTRDRPSQGLRKNTAQFLCYYLLSPIINICLYLLIYAWCINFMLTDVKHIYRVGVKRCSNVKDYISDDAYI